METVSTERASKISGHSVHMLHYYQRHSILEASLTSGKKGVGRRYSYSDLMLLVCLKSLTNTGMSITKIKKHLETYKEKKIEWQSLDEKHQYFALNDESIEILDKDELSSMIFEKLDSYILIIDLVKIKEKIKNKIQNT